MPAYLKSGQSTVSWQSVFGQSLKDTKSPDPGYWKHSQQVDFDTLRGTYTSYLDTSQLDAVELALHNRVAVVQGPPGTGKTFIGYRLAELLLSVSTLPLGPILVLSYKNHILNEFLNGCLKFCKDNEVVRVGGQREKLSNTGVAHFKSMCPRPHLPLSSTPDEFCQLKRLFDIVPLMVEFMPVRELRNIAVMAGLYHSVQSIDMEECEVRDRLMFAVNEWPDAYLSDVPLKEKVDDGNRSFAEVVRSIQKMLVKWLTDENSLEKLLTKHGVLQPVGQPSSQSSSWTSKLQDLSVRNSLDVDEDDEIQLLDVERDFEPTVSTEHEEMKFVVPLASTDRRPQRKGIPKFVVDAARVESTLLTEKELRCTLSHCHVKKHMIDEELAHMIKILVQLKWTTSIEALGRKSKELSQAFARVEEQHNDDSAQLLKKKARIIGMTTNGAAINQELLNLLKPAVIIIEEAAEILETQVLAVLLPSVQHLIMIGDHKQLRPPVETYGLRKKNKFDISMLERLVNNNHPHVFLTHQGRMLPKFVPLLNPIYNNLQTNFKAVKKNQPTNCLSKPMFFWSHEHREEQVGTSFVNVVEGHMIMNSVLWCILQSEPYCVHPSKITIISMYGAQVQFIRNLVRKFQQSCGNLVDRLSDSGQTVIRRRGRRIKQDTESKQPFIKVCTVDQYQGDENDLVFVSLVRSNDVGKLGHVGSENRMCVSCSRARSGLYLFGNADCFRKAKDATHWQHALKYFEQNDALIKSVPLQCPWHPSATIQVSQPSDFGVKYDRGIVSPPKLCQKPCGQMMNCGTHPCLKECHPHLGDEKCEVLVDVNLSCGHSHSCPCWESVFPLQWNFECREQCERTINCPRQHDCHRKCGDRCPLPSECIMCQRLEMKRRNCEARRKRAVEEKIRHTIAKETELLKVEEQHCSVTRLDPSDDDDDEVKIKLHTVKQIISGGGGVSGTSSLAALQLVDCWEITNVTQVSKFVEADKQMLLHLRRHLTPLQRPYMALVVPSTCGDVDQFVKDVADHGVMPTDTVFGTGIFVAQTPGPFCILEGPCPYQTSRTPTDSTLLTLIICQVALGCRRNKKIARGPQSQSGSVPPVSEWGHQTVRQKKYDKESSPLVSGESVLQVVAADQVLPAYVVSCQKTRTLHMVGICIVVLVAWCRWCVST